MPREPLTADKSKPSRKKAAPYSKLLMELLSMARILRQEICLPRPCTCLKAIRELSGSAGSDELVNTFGRMWQNLFT